MKKRKIPIKKAFWITFGFFVFFFAAMTLFSSYRFTSKDQMQEINQKIVELNALKDWYQNKVKEHIKQAKALKSYPEEKQTYSHHLKFAKANEDIVNKIQKDLTKLEKKKKSILKKQDALK